MRRSEVTVQERIPAWRKFQVADSPADVVWEPVMTPLPVPIDWASTIIDSEQRSIPIEWNSDYQLALRNDTNSLLGVMKSNYRPLFNYQVTKLCDYLIDKYEFTFEAVTEFEGGATLFYTLGWPMGSWSVAGDASNWLTYINLVNNHSGLRQFSVMPSAMRPACANVIRSWTHNGKQKDLFFARRHTQAIEDFDSLTEDVSALVGKGLRALMEMSNVSQLLQAAKPIITDQFVNRWLPMPKHPGEESTQDEMRTYRRRRTHVQNKRRTFMNVLRSDTAAGEPDNAYAIWQAAIECDQHYFTTRGAESRARRNITGGSELSDSALRIVGELVSA